MNKLTKEQAIVIMGYTGVTTINFSEFHVDVEQRLGHPVSTHQFGDKDFFVKVKQLYKQDFIDLCVD